MLGKGVGDERPSGPHGKRWTTAIEEAAAFQSNLILLDIGLPFLKWVRRRTSYSRKLSWDRRSAGDLLFAPAGNRRVMRLNADQTLAFGTCFQKLKLPLNMGSFTGSPLRSLRGVCRLPYAMGAALTRFTVLEPVDVQKVIQVHQATKG